MQELATVRREAAGRAGAAGAAGAGPQGGEAGPEGRRPFAEGYPEFDPDQRRDEDGRWTDGGGGGGGGSKASGAGDRTPSPVAEDPRREGMRFLRDPEEDRQGGGTDPAPGGVPLKPPAAKADSTDGWDEFRAALIGDPKLSERQRGVLADIFALEGGLQRDKGPKGADGKPKKGSSAYAGILMQTFKDAADADIVSLTDANGKERKPSDLTTEEVKDIKVWYMDNALRKVGGIAAIERFPDTRTATLVMDAMYQHGNTSGGAMIQRAVNSLREQMTPAERKKFGLTEPLAANGMLRETSGNVLFSVLNSSPVMARKFRSALINERKRYITARYPRKEGEEESPLKQGELNRLDYFKD